MYDENMVRYAFKQIVKGVHFQHIKCRRAHLDIKFENIVLSDEIIPMLADFGFSELVDTLLTEWRGTDYYFSPEMHDLRKRSEGHRIPMPEVKASAQDMYALGVILFTLFFGVHPYMHKQHPKDVLKNEDDYKK